MGQPTIGTADKPMTGASSTSYPQVKTGQVIIRNKSVKTMLPEIGDVNSAEYYVRAIGGAFASFGSTLPLGRKVLTPAEEAAWFPSILGIAPNHVEWDKQLNNYWNSLYVNVPYAGLTLNTTITYRSKDDVGIPDNVANYILWRYCLKYKRVANSIADVNKTDNIWFYMWSKEEETKARLTDQQIKDRAFILRMEVAKTLDKATAVLLLYNVEPAKTTGELSVQLAEIADKDPNRFIKIASDDQLVEKALIKKYVILGLLKNPLNTSAIMYEDKIIGNDYNEALAWLNHPNNTQAKATLMSQLNQSK